MLYFDEVKEERKAYENARSALTRLGLEIELSGMAIDLLHEIAQTKKFTGEAFSDKNQVIAQSLLRKGFIHRPTDNMVKVTEVGKAVLKLAEICGLVSRKMEVIHAKAA